MIFEIISVGDELLSGKITDTNSSFLAKEITDLGMICLFKSTVSDNGHHIRDALDIALSRANIILFTGGLGPTNDDLTVESIASYFNKETVINKDIADGIETLFKSRGIEMPLNNLKQAYIPEGAEILNNSVGTAPGIIWDVSDLTNYNGKKLILTFPGVPQEMKIMWKNEARNILKQFSKFNIYDRHVNFTGISESKLVEELAEIIDNNDPIVLPYANNYQIQLRVFSRNENIEKAKEKVENTIKEIQNIVGEYIYGYDEDTLESVVGQLLIIQNKTLAIAESCTGGLVSSRLTDISGSSKYIKLNLVTYANEFKESLLKIPKEIIEKHGAVSKEVAELMAINVRKIANTDIGVSLTGIAGPTGGSKNKPVGTIYIAITNGKDTQSYKMYTNYDLKREMIKWRFSQFALNTIRNYLSDHSI